MMQPMLNSAADNLSSFSMVRTAERMQRVQALQAAMNGQAQKDVYMYGKADMNNIMKQSERISSISNEEKDFADDVNQMVYLGSVAVPKSKNNRKMLVASLEEKFPTAAMRVLLAQENGLMSPNQLTTQPPTISREESVIEGIEGIEENEENLNENSQEI